MSTSGTITFNETRDQIITNALSLLSVIAAGETPTANDIILGASFLNAMIKAWMGQGIHLWTEEQGTLFLIQGQSSYILQAGVSGSHASDGTGTPVETTLNSAIGAGASSVQVTTSTGMTIGDNIGVVQDNATVFWTTISNIAGTTVSLTAVTTYAGQAGNGVFTYTTQLPRVLSIQSARLRDNNGFDKIMEIKAREDYMRIPQKYLQGDPILIYYSPQLIQGQVYIWPTPYDVNKRIEMTYLREIQDFDNSTDAPDLPQEWLEAITFNLAVRLAPAYGISLSSGGLQGNPDLLLQAANYLQYMLAWDTEQPYVQIVRKSNGRR